MSDDERPAVPLNYVMPDTPHQRRLSGEAIACMTLAAIVLLLFIRFGVYAWLVK